MSFHHSTRRPVRRDWTGKLIVVAAVVVTLFIVVVGFIAGQQARQDCVAQGGVYESDGECEVNGEDLYELD